MKQRIQKVLADAGVAGRRSVEEMIFAGRISVNGEVVMSVPCFVDTRSDKITIDGEPVRIKAPPRVYFLLNKPKNVASIRRQDIKTVYDLIPRVVGLVHCVGPLNSSDSGLIIMTTDGELAQLLTHPSYGIEKTYRIEVEGKVQGPAIEKLQRGTYMGRYRTEGAHVRIVRRNPQRSVIKVTLAEGKNREIRRVLKRVGLNILSLKRIAFGPVDDSNLKTGQFRKLSSQEVTKLRAAVRR